jgi:hypothetical protein
VDNRDAPDELAEVEGYKLLNDQPNVGVALDPLGFEQIALGLAETVVDARGSSPFTLGIEGGWGTGKSSLMGRVESHLDDAEGIKTVWFESWAAEDGRALESLVKSTLVKLDPNVLRRLARNRSFVSWARIAVTIVASFFRVGTIVDTIWDRLALNPAARNELRDQLEKEMEKWVSGNPAVPAGRLLVVFIDDLDRCSPTNVLQIFEAIKLYLNTLGFVFVIGYDKTIVSEAVMKRKGFSAAVTGTDYLEKIIQVSYRMPRPSEDGALSLIDAYLAESRTSDLFRDSALKSLVIERSASNPRRIKRFINSFILEYSLDSEWQEEFTPGDVVRVVILYMYFSEFAALLDGWDSVDPVEKFFAYVDVRATLDQKPKPADTPTWNRIVDFAREYAKLGLDPKEGAERAIEELEQRLPPCFRTLREQEGFAALLTGLGDSDQRQRLRSKLQRRRPSVLVDTPGEATAAEPTPRISFQAVPKPTGHKPYHLSLLDHLDRDQAADLKGGAPLTFHVAGSTGSPQDPSPQQAVAAAMVEDIAASKVAFFYNLGDVVMFFGEAENYHSQFYEPYADYNRPIFAIPGNHDGDVGPSADSPSLAAFVANFCAPPAGSSRTTAETGRAPMTQPNVYWTLETPLVRIVGLYTNVPEGGQLDEEQTDWLIDELKTAPADQGLLVALHHDPYTLGRGESARMAALLDDAFTRSGRTADLVLSGHSHNYQYFTRAIGGRAVAYVVAGAGGYRNLKKVPRNLTMPVRAGDVTLSTYIDDAHGFLRLAATREQIVGQYVAVSRDGSASDTRHAFTISLQTPAG